MSVKSAEKQSSLYKALSLPKMYQFAMSLAGAHRARSIIADDYLCLKSTDSILDIGCGPGDMVSYLPSGVHYEGFDMNPEYIRQAQATFGDKATFQCQRVSLASLEDKTAFYDVILAFGILHHLNDEEASQLFQLANTVLKPNGRLVTIDPCIDSKHSKLANLMVKQDRGEHVRNPQHYLSLANTQFNDVDMTIRGDLIRLPYIHCILECTRS